MVAGVTSSFLSLLALPRAALFRSGPAGAWALLLSTRVETLDGRSDMIGTGVQAGPLRCLGTGVGQRVGKEGRSLLDGSDGSQGLTDMLLVSAQSY